MIIQPDAPTDDASLATRRLILHDGLNFLGLVMVTLVLFAITLFLFRSFTAHRADLARECSAEGARDIQSGRPEAAIDALRTALSYAPDTRAYELLLAQALGEAGHTEESYNYFMGLWGAEPGNGFINLQLARLAAKRNDHASAVNFYRAAIYGTWEGDGAQRRPQVRLELARYLLAVHEQNQARTELLIAAGNANETPDLDLTLGGLLEQADDAADASTYYGKALATRPADLATLEAAGRLAYRSGDFAAAHRMFAREKAVRDKGHPATPLSAEDLTLDDNASRILELVPLPGQPSRERIRRILSARALARKRLDACALTGPPALQDLSARWAAAAGTANASTLARDSGQQDAAMQLVYDTEVQTEKLCGAATGDDALLLLAAASTSTPLPASAAAPR